MADDYAKRHCGDGVDTKYLARDTLDRLTKYGRLEDKLRAGRPKVAFDEDVDEFLRIFLRGNGERPDRDTWWGFTSLGHALQEKAELRKLLEKMNIKQEALWVRLKARYYELYGKKLKKISIVSRPAMSKATMQKRLKVAEIWKNWGFEKLCKVVWIDEKQEYLHSGGTYKCYAPPDTKSMQRAAKTHLGKSERVKYEAAVSAFAGAVYFTFVTGTTGREQHFMVRTFVPRWRHLDPPLLVALLPCLI